MNPRFRWVLLLVASYYFYMSWKPEYAILILLSTVIDYFCGIQMSRQKDKRKRRPFLIISLLSNLGMLIGFKYFNFISESIEFFAKQYDSSIELPLLNFLLPVGISFYTFQTLSYSIDVYRGEQQAERHFGHFALFVSFFPQLVAGPIERFGSLSPQLKSSYTLSYDNLRNGLRLILYGLFTKMVIADNLGIIVDLVYGDPDIYGSSGALIASLFYSFQIYGDFFGYSLVAIGSANLLGVTLMDNFRTPYLSTGIAEFWQRWHISLSTWFRDYLYFPLGGNRVKLFRWIFNILAVFLISGLWHGANYTFIIWGGIFAFFYLLEGFWKKLFGKKEKVAIAIKGISIAITFLVVTLAWVFFRSPDLETATKMIQMMFSGATSELSLPSLGYHSTLLAIFVLADIVQFNSRFDKWIDGYSVVIRWTVYLLLLFAIVALSGVEDKPFIYFQF